MKRLILFLFIGAMLHAQPTQCNQTNTLTSATNGGQFHNAVQGRYCNTWVLTYWNTGFSALSIQVEGAADSAGTPGSFSAISGVLLGSNPSTSTTGGTIIFQPSTFYPWMRVNITSVSGSGTITYQLNGSSGIIARAFPTFETWGGHVGLTSASTGQVGALLMPPNAATIIRFGAFVLTPGVTCSTAPVLSIRDTTTSTNLVSLTVTNGASTLDSGVISVAVTPGDALTPDFTTAGSGCGTNASGIEWLVIYRS